MKLLVFLFSLLPIVAWADPSSIGSRINVRVYDGYRSGIIFHDTRQPSTPTNPCFPHRCGEGIIGPITNPNPRTENEKPACYYGPDDILFYEKEGKHCPYVRVDQNKIRVERRRQEWLQAQERLRRTRPGS